MNVGQTFDRVAHRIARYAGRAPTFGFAVGMVLGWAASGPLFGWSDTWQMVINTSTTVVTFLMVFVIQNTQNRDTEAVQLKLDELIVATERARNRMVQIEDLTQDELDAIKDERGAV